MTGPPLVLVTGQPTTRAVQCHVYGSGTVPAIFNSTDILTASVVPARQTSPIFMPGVNWYTATGTQSGYGEGQVEVTLTAAEMALLVPTISYTLIIYRALEGNPTNAEMIAQIRLVIKAIS